MDDALTGVRILDNGIVQAGTFPARLLADFGAEVVRVENFRRPDLSRNPVFPDGTPGVPAGCANVKAVVRIVVKAGG